MFSRAFVAGLVAVAVPVGVIGLVASLSDGGPPGPLPVNTVQGAPGDLGPPIVGSGVRTRPRSLSPTPAVPGATSPDYGMTTAEGNQAVDVLVKQIRKALRDHRLRNAAGLEAALDFGIATIADRGFAEVHKKPVIEAIGRALEGDIKAAGIDPQSVVIG